MLHRFPGADAFDREPQRPQLEYMTSSKAGMTSLAENYAGRRFDGTVSHA